MAHWYNEGGINPMGKNKIDGQRCIWVWYLWMSYTFERAVENRWFLVKKEIEKIRVSIKYIGGYMAYSSDEKEFDNTQDAQSYLQAHKCYNKETRHQWWRNVKTGIVVTHLE